MTMSVRGTITSRTSVSENSITELISSISSRSAASSSESVSSCSSASSSSSHQIVGRRAQLGSAPQARANR